MDYLFLVGTEKGLLIISRGTAILLLLVYVAYLFFQVLQA